MIMLISITLMEIIFDRDISITFMDLAKAFDAIDHDFLLLKPKAHGSSNKL